MKKEDTKFLSSLSKEELKRLKWYAKNPPRPRAKNQIPQDKKSLELWEKLSYSKGKKKIFPKYNHYAWSCRKFGIIPEPKFKKGIPADILNEIKIDQIPRSYIDLYEKLYKTSSYNRKWKMRSCEISIGLMMKLTKKSDSTVRRALKYLRDKFFVRRIWRGFLDPRNNRYRHSCYELPFNFNHVFIY